MPMWCARTLHGMRSIYSLDLFAHIKHEKSLTLAAENHTVQVCEVDAALHSPSQRADNSSYTILYYNLAEVPGHKS